LILQKGSRPRGRGRGGGGRGWGGERRAEHGGRLTAVCAFQGFGPRRARRGGTGTVEARAGTSTAIAVVVAALEKVAAMAALAFSAGATAVDTRAARWALF